MTVSLLYAYTSDKFNLCNVLSFHEIRAMESFKVYLPSNASTNVFPANTPTNYRTQFEKEIRLEGEWEVGVEGIFYSSHIEEESEKAIINLSLYTEPAITVNSIYPYEFKFSPKNEWLGYKAFEPEIIAKDPNNVEKILDCLNYLNVLILSPEKRRIYGRIFKFDMNAEGEVIYHGFCESFTLELTAYLCDVLGFSYRIIFSGSREIKSFAPRKPGTRKLTRNDYRMKYFDSSVLQREKRIVIKKASEEFHVSKEDFLDRWKTAVNTEAGYAIRAEFGERNQLILHNFQPDIGIVFSPEFATTFGHTFSFFGKGSRWAFSATYFSRTDNFANEEWYIDIYNNKPDMTVTSVTYDTLLKIQPWKFSDIGKLMTFINAAITRKIKHTIKETYEEDAHRFELSRERDFSKLLLGRSIKTKFSKNLYFLLGFDKSVFTSGITYAVREPSSLLYRERKLFLVTDVIKPTAHGKDALPILQDFVHVSKAHDMIEKRFHPIIYVPISSNYIDSILIQLTDEMHQPVSISDSKTVVSLYFRKVRGKTML